MGTAYTPGLKVTRQTRIETTRRLPIRGEVLKRAGDRVAATDVVARAELPGDMETVRISEVLGVEPVEAREYLHRQVGDQVNKGDLLAEVSAFFGLFKASARAPVNGRIEFFSEVTGHLGVRRPPTPVEVNAYIDGLVTAVIPDQGVTIRTTGAMVQGIFGVGPEQRGRLRLCATDPEQELLPDHLPPDIRGCVIVGGALARIELIRRAAELGAVGLVTGGILDQDLAAYLGYDLGVAVTGNERVPCTLIATEGFGRMAMAHRTYDLLSSLEGRMASINGATQIRAGALRPEIVVPDPAAAGETPGGGLETVGMQLDVGTQVRMIRVPYFGRLGEVVELPPAPEAVESGARVRVLRARLRGGETVTVPRANVEIIQA